MKPSASAMEVLGVHSFHVAKHQKDNKVKYRSMGGSLVSYTYSLFRSSDSICNKNSDILEIDEQLTSHAAVISPRDSSGISPVTSFLGFGSSGSPPNAFPALQLTSTCHSQDAAYRYGVENLQVMAVVLSVKRDMRRDELYTANRQLVVFKFTQSITSSSFQGKY